MRHSRGPIPHYLCDITRVSSAPFRRRPWLSRVIPPSTKHIPHSGGACICITINMLLSIVLHVSCAGSRTRKETRTARPDGPSPFHPRLDQGAGWLGDALRGVPGFSIAHTRITLEGEHGYNTRGKPISSCREGSRPIGLCTRLLAWEILKTCELPLVLTSSSSYFVLP
jgi:hypothetical protein